MTPPRRSCNPAARSFPNDPEYKNRSHYLLSSTVFRSDLWIVSESISEFPASAVSDRSNDSAPSCPNPPPHSTPRGFPNEPEYKSRGHYAMTDQKFRSDLGIVSEATLTPGRVRAPTPPHHRRHRALSARDR